MILVTGGAGFIGSNLIDRLIENGQRVVLFDDFNDYYSPIFKEENIAHYKKNKNVVLIRGDITDKEAVDAVFQKYSIEKVVHLAARAGVRPSIQDPILYQSVNIAGTLNILEAMKAAGCQKFYFASSSSVYGNQEKVPFSESDPVDTPISPYAATKKACEHLAYTYHHLYQFTAVGFRFFTVYGERGRPDMAPYLFSEHIMTGKPIKKFGDGSTERDYTYVGDIVGGIYQSLDKELGYEIINLGNHQTVTLNHLIETIESLTGKRANIHQQPMQPGDVKKTFADITKAKKLLGYEPKTSIEEGMDRFISWYKKNRAVV